jgi:outer membrane protein OmpA-like peptidoglycan-associated protein
MITHSSTTRITSSILAAICIGQILFLSVVHGADTPPKSPDTWFAGYYKWINNNEKNTTTANYAVGAEAAIALNEDWVARLSHSYLHLDPQQPDNTGSGQTFGADILYMISQQQPWYLYAGLERQNQVKHINNLNIGLGRHWALDKKWHIYTEAGLARGLNTHYNDGQIKIGLLYRPHKTIYIPKDQDQDGVIDRRDKCANSPFGDPVTDQGCPVDSDNDAVADHLDKCANSPSGFAVDLLGCNFDPDQDGVSQPQDRCPDSPIGFAVDSSGCNLDHDKDGITEPNDSCPASPLGYGVNSQGCNFDKDQDGVAEPQDQCQDSPVGFEVDPAGCNFDSDQDGITEPYDLCPASPAGYLVNTSGCNMDKDSDGILEPQDRCAHSPVGFLVDPQGCNLDQDSDGILDPIDLCPNTPKALTVDNKGCNTDNDFDGVKNSLDQCPDSVLKEQVNPIGCPSDRDNDSISDRLDNCPNTPIEDAVDGKGCSLYSKNTLQKSLNISFVLGTPILRQADDPQLKKFADFMGQHTDTSATLIGHASKQNEQGNLLQLALRRAEAVRQILIQQFGIAPNRLSTQGKAANQSLVQSNISLVNKVKVLRTIN